MYETFCGIGNRRLQQAAVPSSKPRQDLFPMSKPVPNLGTVELEFSVARSGLLGWFKVVFVLSTSGVNFGNDPTTSKERVLRSTGEGTAVSRQIPLPEVFVYTPLVAMAKTSTPTKPILVGLIS